MRLKYYLRGLGIGIIGTAIILSFSLNGKEQVLSEEEIIQRAENLGMVMQSEQEELEEEKQSTGILQQIQENKEDKQETVSEKEDASSEKEEEKVSIKDADNVVFVIDVNEGDDCLTVCEKVEAAGLVSSAIEFKHYLFLHDLDTKISLGSHPIPKGSQMEEIAALLCEE